MDLGDHVQLAAQVGGQVHSFTRDSRVITHNQWCWQLNLEKNFKFHSKYSLFDVKEGIVDNIDNENK